MSHRRRRAGVLLAAVAGLVLALAGSALAQTGVGSGTSRSDIGTVHCLTGDLTWSAT